MYEHIKSKANGQFEDELKDINEFVAWWFKYMTLNSLAISLITSI